MLIRAGEVHSTQPQTEKLRVLVVKFLPTVLCRSGLAAPRSLDAFLAASGHYSLSKLNEQQYRQIRDTFGTLLKEYRDQAPGVELILTAELYRLAGLLLRFKIVSIQWDGLSAAEHARIEQMLLYVEEHGQNGLSLRQLADEFQLNYAYMSRYFKKRMGKTFREYLLGVRTARADLLLQQGDKTIAQIAKETGFTSPQAFSRSYRQIKGYPPSIHKKVN